MRHVPVWFDRFPKSRSPSYPRLRGEHEGRVVVVGGGLTGMACALSFAAAGIDVVLLEANALGGGLAAGAPGVLREGFAGSFQQTASICGMRVTRAMWEALRRGSLDFAAALRRYGIRCDLQPQDLVMFASASPDASRWLRREYDVRHAAGIEGSWMTPAAVGRETAMDSGGGIRTRGFVIDPYRATLGMAAAAAARGARLHERSAVTRIRASKRHVDVLTASGAIRADTVIVCTGAPIQDLRSLRRHLRPENVYGVITEPMPAAVRRQVGHRKAVLEDAQEPYRLVRWIADDRVFVHGGRQPEVPERGRERAIVQRTGQLMYEFSLLYPAISGLQPEASWDAVDYQTVDGLPFLGPHRNFPRHLFAFGSARHGAGLAWTAARLVLRHFQGEPAKGDSALGFTRSL